MSLKMPITKRKVHNHFQYSFWKYLLLVVIALFGWNLIYTSTRYQPPEDKKIEFYAEAITIDNKDIQTLADQIHEEVMPEMEEVTATAVTYDDTYGNMQLTVWVSAGQGDVYLLSKDRFQSLAENDALLDLAPYVESGRLNTGGLDVTNGYVNNSETGKHELLGIPSDELTGLSDYGALITGSVLCVLANNGNDDYSILFLNYLLEHMQTSAAETAAPSTTTAP